ncbi:hypothetical protein HPULCUR_001501 [Helicostylum pulchrum]|uniref:Uncharacterized protein n=1 Tax=Helicostylum pulchrum TaxID=562976 RepID=A0ABP9XPV4_9FUNG
MFEWYYRVHGHHIYEMASTGDAAHNINRSNHASTFEITSEDSIVDFYDLCTVPSTLLRLTTIVAELVCAISIYSLYSKNVIVIGGNTFFPGFTKILSNDLPMMVSGINVCDTGSQIERTSNSWLGSSMLAYLGTVNQLCISKKEYEESVNSILFVC